MRRRYWYAWAIVLLGMWYAWIGSDVVTTQVFHRLAYTDLILRYAQEHDVPPERIAAVIYTESRFRPDAVSSRGAVGLMQLMPATAAWIAEQEGESLGDLTLPEENIRRGSWYLHYLYGTFRSPVLALAAYNAGRGHVEEWIRMYDWERQPPQAEDIPFPETREFIRQVMKMEQEYYPEFHAKEQL